MDSLNPNKHLKEEFVSNLTGSSMLEISALLTIIPVLVLLRHSISSYRVNVSVPDANEITLKKKKCDDAIIVSKNLSCYVTTLAIDFLFIVVPSILVFTVLAEWTYVWAILSVLLLISSIAAKRFSSSPPHSERRPHSLRKNISSYRVATMIVTCLCILAVDFRIFPRKYAKTETYGTGLMDLGVGFFVLANSIVSRQARNVSSVVSFSCLLSIVCVIILQFHAIISAAAVDIISTIQELLESRNWKTALQSTSPLILLGFGRLVSTAGVDYQVHVGEYGVHWNFFFTLAAVSILTSIFNVLPQYSGILGSVILIGYQSWLNQGLNVYLLSNERGMDIISKNKEGIFSIFGYWGLYLVGVQLGHYLFFGNHSPATLRSNKWARTRVWILSLLFWLLTILLDRHVERVSRRMCNLAYVTWVLAQNLQVLAILMLSDYIPGSETTALEEAFNRNLLASFLLANVLTGLVNLLVDTLSASLMSALLILFVYAFILSATIGFVDFYAIRLKFW